MKTLLLLAALLFTLLTACNRKTFATNGETIYRTGRNLKGEQLLDRAASSLTFVNACATCHGKHGDRINKASVRFRDLSDPAQFAVPYTDTLFYRFLDEDLKSNGRKANIGVIWKMSAEDKADLLEYLKGM